MFVNSECGVRKEEITEPREVLCRLSIDKRQDIRLGLLSFTNQADDYRGRHTSKVSPERQRHSGRATAGADQHYQERRAVKSGCRQWHCVRVDHQVRICGFQSDSRAVLLTRFSTADHVRFFEGQVPISNNALMTRSQSLTSYKITTRRYIDECPAALKCCRASRHRRLAPQIRLERSQNMCWKGNRWWRRRRA